ncbi:MAG: hydrocarbon degradation protein [Aquificaceae bacterium]|nr:MAG: hydrocarbon degradation protein [Aquificaceae bacterium]
MYSKSQLHPLLLRSSCSLLVLSSIMLSSAASAAGFAIIENSASGMGKAFAGASAVAEDTSTIWFNPSGMSYLSEHNGGKAEISSTLHIVAADVDFKDKGSAPPASLGAATNNGVKKSKHTNIGVVPNLYYMRPINDRMNFGIAINAPFGSKVEYDNNWVGRYQATKTDLKSININPSLSWKVNDKLSLGAGVSAQYVEVSLASAVDSAGACRKVGVAVATKTNSTSLIDYCNKTYPKAAQVENDTQAVIEGDGIGYGFNVGLLYQPSDVTRIGLSYRSKISHSLTGKAKFDVNAGLLPVIAQTGINNFTNRDIKASLDLPDSLSLSLAHKFNSRLELLGDITWTGWSSFNELLITEKATGKEVSRVPEKWQDVTRISLGANYQYNDKLTLRTGIALDEEPIPSARYRTPRIPGNDRKWLSVGAGYKLNKKMSLDVGYSHLFMDETAIDNPGDKGYSVKGLYNNDVDIVSAQINYKF